MNSPYWLADRYSELVAKVRQNAVEGLEEAWGVSQYAGGPDFRLNLACYRVIGVFPLARELAVLIEVDKVFRRRHIYQREADFDRLEDAYGYLEITHKNRLWVVKDDTDLQDPYVDQFLSCGMRLMVKEIRRQHPRLTREAGGARSAR